MNNKILVETGFVVFAFVFFGASILCSSNSFSEVKLMNANMMVAYEKLFCEERFIDLYQEALRPAAPDVPVNRLAYLSQQLALTHRALQRREAILLLLNEFGIPVDEPLPVLSSLSDTLQESLSDACLSRFNREGYSVVEVLAFIAETQQIDSRKLEGRILDLEREMAVLSTKSIGPDTQRP